MNSLNDELFNPVLMENIKNVYRKISSASIRSGRSPFDVKLIAVTKTVPAEKVQEAIDLGLRIFGENRVQEAQEKILHFRSHCPECQFEWHLIGHLQRNKAKAAVELFDLIHTVDSIKLAEEVNKHAVKEGKMQRILIQVKLAQEETKHGAMKKDLIPLISAVSGMSNLNLEGLMTMPPFFDDPQKARPYFRELSDLRDEVALRSACRLQELSMGMTNDYEEAILEGATMVRIGTAIFGERRE